MRGIGRLAALGAVMACASLPCGCGAAPHQHTSAASTTVASTAIAPTTVAPSGFGPLPTSGGGPASSCALPTTPELIERTVSPTGPPVAVLVGSANTVLCEPTTQAFRAGVPTDPGWCTTLARYDDNPGYDVNAVPAPPLQKVIASAGAAC